MRSLLHVMLMGLAGALAAIAATFRRLLLGPTLPSWSWRTEWAVASARSVIEVAARYRDDPMLLRFGMTVQAPVPFGLRDKVHLRKVRIAGIEADRYEPVRSARNRTILYFHGGGYVFGNPGTHRQFIARLVNATGAFAVAPRYGLAPRHQFPAAVNDAQAAYEALLDRGLDPASIIVAGDSAGGGLSMALLHRIRESGLPVPAGAVLFSPYLDLEHKAYTIALNAATDYLPLSELSIPNHWYASLQHMRDPEASPVNAELTGFPPLLVFAGGAEMLLGDSIMLAERAESAAVSCKLVVEPDMMHVWPAIVEWEPASDRALATANDWIETLGG